MKIAVRTWAKNGNSTSVYHGPLAYSLKIGERWQKYGADEKWPAFEVFATTPWNYALVADPAVPRTLYAGVAYRYVKLNRIAEYTAVSTAGSNRGGGVSTTSGTTANSQKVKLMHALPFRVEYAVKSPRWLVAPSCHVSFKNCMPFNVTFSDVAIGLVPGLWHGLTPSATFTSKSFCRRFVPATKGRYTRAPLSDSLTRVEPGGYLKLNKYVPF